MARSLTQTVVGAFVVAGFFGIVASADADEWTDLTPPYGAVSVAIDPTAPATLYVGNGEGVFKSTDGGANWNAVGWTFGGMVSRVAVDPLTPSTLDGRSSNGHYWVFYGALSSVAYTITVTDTRTGAVRTYENAQGNQASVGDTDAF